MDSKRRIAILGASGSIGQNAIRVIREHSDKLELVAIAGGSRIEPLAAIAREFDVKQVTVFHPPENPEILRSAFSDEVTLTFGMEGLIEVATREDIDMVLVAVVGTTALQPCIAAIKAGKDIALASKEILVMAGEFIIPLVHEHNCLLLPTDSEHNAIFQCLQGHDSNTIEKLLITASGGRYREAPLESLEHITAEEAVQHPNWSMGPKISIDSSTMANKGLEVIEARWLFGVQSDQIEVVIHPQSIVHSMVQFNDGSILAQLSPPNMSFAIQNCLLYPERHPGVDETLDFRKAMSLDFESPSAERFPCLQLAFETLRQGGCAPAIFNAANEIAVQAFVEKRISYLDIPRLIEFTLNKMNILRPSGIEAIIAADLEARRISHQWTL